MKRHLIAALGVACAGGRPDDPVPPEYALLTRTEAWTVATGLTDPWSAEEPPNPACEPIYYGPTVELTEPSFSIQTDFCSPITIVQPLAAAVEPGDHLCFRVWHDELWAREPATGEIELRIDGTPLRDWSVPIPGPRDVILDAWDAEAAIPAGAMVQLHLRNHGINSWNILEWRATPSEDAPPTCVSPPPPDGTGITPR